MKTRAEFLRFPEAGLSIICLANRSDVNPPLLCNRVAGFFLEEGSAPEVGRGVSAGTSDASDEHPPKREPPPEPEAGEAAAYAGTYWSPELAVEFTIAYERGQLSLLRPRRPPAALGIVARDVFQGPRLTLSFRRSEDSTVAGFVLESSGLGGFRFDRR